MSLSLIAHTTKGFEEITELEIRSRIPQVTDTDISAKRVLFKTDDIRSLSRLFTINDLNVLVATNHPLANKISTIPLSEELIARIQEARERISELRSLDNTFSITVSRYKNKTEISSLTDTLSQELSDKLDMNFTPRSHENFDIRFDLTSEACTVSIRLSEKPAFHREYKIQSQTGALKPSIAGGMVFASVGISEGLNIVDNLCGSGTILCEAALSMNMPWGGDISENSVDVAQVNMATLNSNYASNIKNLDAKSSPWKENFFDAAISNLPWDRLVETSSITGLYEGVIQEYSRIVKPDGAVAILSKKPDLVRKLIKKYLPVQTLAEYPLGFLGQNPTLVVANSRMHEI